MEDTKALETGTWHHVDTDTRVMSLGEGRAVLKVTGSCGAPPALLELTNVVLELGRGGPIKVRAMTPEEIAAFTAETHAAMSAAMVGG